MIYLEIGEVREIDGTNVRCVGTESYYHHGCTKCVFFEKSTMCSIVYCYHKEREDKTDVYFELVEEYIEQPDFLIT